MVEPENIAEIRSKYTVLSTRFSAGKIELRVLADEKPAEMSSAAPELEDVYFGTLIEHGLKENME